MSKRFYIFGLIAALFYLGSASAQYPIMDSVANKIIMKYQTSTCEQLYQSKAQKQQPGPGEQKAIQMLHNDPQMLCGVYQQSRASYCHQDVPMRHDSIIAAARPKEPS